VAEGKPTAVVVACADRAVARHVQDELSGPTFRAYASTDVAGVELGGALKNVIAIAGGMLSGLELGHDPLAAVITRGLREITSLGVAMGAQRETFMGLAGLGDLVLTCTGGASRNRRLGEALARGLSLDQARREIGQVAEGVETCDRALSEARRHGINMPITEGVSSVLFEGRSVRDMVDAIMQRSLKDEEG
jgi:glycerol-3-phosphate dehydrogenase (NAD(P)+)